MQQSLYQLGQCSGLAALGALFIPLSVHLIPTANGWAELRPLYIADKPLRVGDILTKESVSRSFERSSHGSYSAAFDTISPIGGVITKAVDARRPLPEQAVILPNSLHFLAMVLGSNDSPVVLALPNDAPSASFKAGQFVRLYLTTRGNRPARKRYSFGRAQIILVSDNTDIRVFAIRLPKDRAALLSEAKRYAEIKIDIE